MPSLSLHISPSGSAPFELKAPDMNAALAVIDINTRAGYAEIWKGRRRLARLRRRGHAVPFWEVF